MLPANPTTRVEEYHVLMSSMSSAAIEQEIRSGSRTVIVVAGSVEQHGPHLPCSTDSIYGAEFATRTARRLGSTLVAPVITPGVSDHHLGFAGTFSIPAPDLVAIVKAYLSNLALMGVERVVLTSSHGGNFGPLSEALDELTAHAELLKLKLVPVLSLLDFVAALRKAPDGHGLDQGLPAVQADLIETSIMLSIRPELVRMELAEVGYLDDFDIDQLFRDGLRSITPNGILGDPRGATAQLGAEILDDLTDYLYNGIMSAEEAS